jgi:hypothetical protein
MKHSRLKGCDEKMRFSSELAWPLNALECTKTPQNEEDTRVLHFSRFVSPDWSLHILHMNSLRLRAVLYRQDGLWVAHALEMDLIGTGATESAALRELRGNVEAQLSFATQEGTNPFRPAPQEIQSLWEETNLAAIGLGRGKAFAKQATRCLEWSQSQVSRMKSNAFQRA